MKNRLLPAFLLTGAMTVALVAQSASQTAWNIGDLFVAVDDAGAMYRTFAPDGSRENAPDLVETTGAFATGCAVDPSVAAGDLFTTTWSTPILRFSGTAPHALLNTYDVADVSSAPLAPGVPPLPAAFLTPADRLSVPAIESVVFDNTGNMYLGAQAVPSSATGWLGYGWIIKMSRAGHVLGWWRVDAGAAEYSAGTPQLVNGVAWMDLARDQSTIFYTSGDGYIRSFNVTTATQGAPIPIHGDSGVVIGQRVYALRILPPGDPSNGFLVATSELGVSRVDASGYILRRYLDPSTTDYFSLAITPDGASFWTGTVEGQLYRFHIASGAMAGPFPTGTSTSYGLCVKGEYTAASNTCFAADPYGNAIPDGMGGYRTVTCALPPTPASCGANPTDPDCLAPVIPVNQPVCSAAAASQPLLPPDHELANVSVVGVTDPGGDPVSISIDSIWQSEPLDRTSDGRMVPDASGIRSSIAAVLAERSGAGAGRIYQINFTATDGISGSSCTGSIDVGVPHDRGQQTMPVDPGIRYDAITGARIR